VASQTLPAFPSPQEVNQQVLLTLWKLGESLFVTCDWSDDQFSCRNRATVHHLEMEQDYCLGHFREVARG
jgi:hypothetical protein